MSNLTGNLSEVGRSFLPLGWTAFGGPAAHLGYFRTEFVHRRGWLGDATYADLVAMSQFLPGPASSKVGMALGYARAGLAGMAYSWFLFTFPSALILTVFGLAVPGSGVSWLDGLLAGLLAAAAGVVVHAIVGMAKKLLTTPTTWALALISSALLLVAGSAWQLAVLAAAGLLGATGLRRFLPTSEAVSYTHLRAHET